MTEGLEVYKPDGTLLLGVTTYVGMFYGSFSTGGLANGSFTNPKMVGRSLLTFLPDTGLNGSYGGPVITLNPSTGVISWAYTGYNGAAPTIPNETIFYGGY